MPVVIALFLLVPCFFELSAIFSAVGFDGLGQTAFALVSTPFVSLLLGFTVQRTVKVLRQRVQK